jgi:hypothetical protein
MLINQATILKHDELEKNWELVCSYPDNISAFRSKETGLLRIIDVDSGGDILSNNGNPFTKDIEHAKIISDKLMGKEIN